MTIQRFASGYAKRAARPGIRCLRLPMRGAVTPPGGVMTNDPKATTMGIGPLAADVRRYSSSGPVRSFSAENDGAK